MVRFVTRRGGNEPAVILYLPGLRGCIKHQKDFKEAVRSVGGANNTTGLFLRPDQQTIQVTSRTGTNKGSVSRIPESCIAPDVLRRLKEGNLMFIKL